MKYKVELFLIALLPVSMMFGWFLGELIVSRLAVHNTEMVSYTTQTVKNDSVRSVWLIEGYDRRVQHTMANYGYYLPVFDNYELEVR
jgi:hypothetical protein